MAADRPLLSLRWAPEILLALGKGDQRFTRLLNLEPILNGISDRMLTERLKDLEESGLVARDVDAGPPVRVTYRLTGLGQKFVEPLRLLEEVEALVD